MRLARHAAACALIALASPTLAQDCSVFHSLDQFEVTNLAPDNATCATYLTDTAQTGVSCHWPFAFRKGQARVFADTLAQTLLACRDVSAPDTDQAVNHPDSYDAQVWRAAVARYSIAVKDKGALNQTLVFLRMEPN